MGFLDKVRSKSQAGRGHVKQRYGRATGNRRLQAEGLADRVIGTARQLARQVANWLKDAGRDLRRGTQH
ncbi:MAG TPA: CsbD family protein [Streptosporangiaceae bacterium]|jgi:uncharacterized protein YjbJ (UPF0337 family)|nr:CsbD family protein [Streptosporangiaceae bacterium]